MKRLFALPLVGGMAMTSLCLARPLPARQDTRLHQDTSRQDTSRQDTSRQDTSRQDTSPLTLEARVDDSDPLAWRFEAGISRPTTVQLTCDEQGGALERHRVTRDLSGPAWLTIHGLKASTRYTCLAETMGGSRRRSRPVSVVTGALPSDLVLPQITVPSTDPSETAYTLYNTAMVNSPNIYKGNYLVILDALGNVRWYYKGVGGGDIDASWLGADRVLYGGQQARYLNPTLINLDGQIEFQATNAVASRYEEPGTYNHDAGLSVDGQSIFTIVLDYTDRYTGFTLKQIDLATNTVVWSWDSIINGVDAGQLPAGSSSNSDPFHANSVMDQWEEGRLYLYVSLRNLNQVLKIDYLTGTIVWRLGYGGDFALEEADGSPAADDRWFFHQHDAHVYGSSLLAVYDNGWIRDQYGGERYARALRLEIDQQRMTARIALDYSEPGWSEPIWGGHDVLENGNSLVAMGHCWSCQTPPHNSALVELNPLGQVVWRAQFMDMRQMTYRAQRIAGCDIFDNTTFCPAKAY